jgi:hypothetical protein
VHPSLADLPGTPPIESPAFWSNPERVEASSDPDTATAQTIRIMCGHVKRAASDLLLQQTAAQAVSQFGGLAGDTHDAALQVACAAWWWHKLYVKFVLHDFIIANRLGEYGHLQGLISPEILIRMKDPEGDCAIFSMGIAAMLQAFGIPYEFVTVKVSPREPHEYGHVYLYAVTGDGRRIPLDASHGQYPGWQVPSRDILYKENQQGTPALQAWDSDGNPVADQGSRFEGLHMYGLRGGLGTIVCDENGENCYDDGTTYGDTSGGQCPGSPGCPGYVDPLAVSPINNQSGNTTCADGSVVGPGQACPNQWLTPAGTSYSGSVYSAPSQSSAQWAAFATQMAKGGLTLAEIDSIQPGTVVGANGTILRQSTGYAVPGTTLSTALGSNSTLIIALVVGAGLLLFMGKR